MNLFYVWTWAPEQSFQLKQGWKKQEESQYLLFCFILLFTSCGTLFNIVPV